MTLSRAQKAIAAVGATAIVLAAPAAALGALDPVRDWWQADQLEELAELGEALTTRRADAAELEVRVAEVEKAVVKHDRFTKEIRAYIETMKRENAAPMRLPEILKGDDPLVRDYRRRFSANDQEMRGFNRAALGRWSAYLKKEPAIRRELVGYRRTFHRAFVDAVRDHNEYVARIEALSAQVRPARRIAATRLPTPPRFVEKP